MRTLWCKLILGRRDLGYAFPERDANIMVHTHSGLAKPNFSTPRIRREPYGAQSFWVGETSVLRAQNEMRTLWYTLILGWRKSDFALPERDANPLAHPRSSQYTIGLYHAIAIYGTPKSHNLQTTSLYDAF